MAQAHKRYVSRALGLVQRKAAREIATAGSRVSDSPTGGWSRAFCAGAKPVVNGAQQFAFFLRSVARRRPTPHPRMETPPAPTVVELAEAILGGNVLVILQEHGQVPPGWAYINLFAHNDRAWLERVRDHNASRHPLSAWGTVVFELIEDILAVFRTEAELRNAQHNALIPLELAVWGGRPLDSPDDLDVMVRGALHLQSSR